MATRPATSAAPARARTSSSARPSPTTVRKQRLRGSIIDRASIATSGPFSVTSRLTNRSWVVPSRGSPRALDPDGWDERVCDHLALHVTGSAGNQGALLRRGDEHRCDASEEEARGEGEYARISASESVRVAAVEEKNGRGAPAETDVEQSEVGRDRSRLERGLDEENVRWRRRQGRPDSPRLPETSEQVWHSAVTCPPPRLGRDLDPSGSKRLREQR